MKNYLGAIITILFLISYKILGPWSSTYDLIFSGILLFIIGIPHGAGDHLVAKKIAERYQLTFQLKTFILIYIGIMACYALLWFLIPTVAFIIFIAISIFHFGDMEDLFEMNANQTFLTTIRIFLLGSGILSCILFSHWSEVSTIIQEMKVNVPENISPSLIYISLICLVLGFDKKNANQFLNTFFTLIAGFFLPLIPAFICYFSCCHAVNSFRGMKNHLELNVIDLYKKLLPFSFGAILIGYLYMKLLTKNVELYPIFIFFSLLTLPHFLLMHQLIKHPKKHF